MSKGNKILIIVLAVLAGFFLINKYWLSNKTRNFKEVLIELDTAKVTQIDILLPPAKGNSFTLTKQGGEWMVNWAEKHDEADKAIVKSMLSAVAKMNVDGLLGTTVDQWVENEVNDSLGTRVKVYVQDRIVSEFIVGKFNFQPTSRKMVTSVRLAEENNVYGIDGYLASVFSGSADMLRDKTFFKDDVATVSEITTSSVNNTGFNIGKTINGGWAIDGMPADSAKVANYLKGLKNQRFNKFSDDFMAASLAPEHSVVIKNTGNEELLIAVYKEADKYIVHSSQNNNAYFLTDSATVFSKILKAASDFAKPAE